MKHTIYLLTALVTIHSCSKPVKINNQDLILKIQRTYGTSRFNNSIIHFKINDLKYTVDRTETYTLNQLERSYKGTEYKAIYNNGFITYSENDSIIPDGTYLKKIINVKLDAFLFSFSFPHILMRNDINLISSEKILIRNTYFKALTFQINQGAEVPPDKIILYIDPKTFEISYSAESLSITDGFPVFKKYLNHRRIDNILFADFYSFNAISDTIDASLLVNDYNIPNLQEPVYTQFDSIRILPKK